MTVADLQEDLGAGGAGPHHDLEAGASRLGRISSSMLFGPGADSGTFDYFTEAVNGKAKASRGDYTASEDDNMLVQGVEQQQERARLLRLRLLRRRTRTR